MRVRLLHQHGGGEVQWKETQPPPPGGTRSEKKRRVSTPRFREITVWQTNKRVPRLEGELDHTGTKHATPETGVPKSHSSMVVEPEPEERAIRSELGETGDGSRRR